MPRAKDRKGRQWMRAQNAAKALGVTRPTVLAMIARGELRSQTVDELVFVKREDVEAWVQQKAAA